MTGIIAGLGLAQLGSAILQVPISVDPSIVLLAFIFAPLVGIGLFDARGTDLRGRAPQLIPGTEFRRAEPPATDGCE